MYSCNISVQRCERGGTHKKEIINVNNNVQMMTLIYDNNLFLIIL